MPHLFSLAAPLLGGLVAVLLSGTSAQAETIKVSTLSDVLDGDTSDIESLNTKPGDDGAISLREAIVAANNTPGSDTIAFDVSGTINLASELPALSGGGTSIYGGRNITLNGNALTGTESGLILNSVDNLVSGLIIARFQGNGVTVTGAAAADNTVVDCTIGGTTAAAGNDGNGVSIRLGASGTWIGQPGEGNLILFNGGNGINLGTGAGTGTLIRGNLIGVDAQALSRPNTANGIHLSNVSGGTTIGGTSTADANVISSNGEYGIRITGFGNDPNTVLGNIIGGSVSGLIARGNTLGGVILEGGAGKNTIGGTAPGARNVISGNLGEGILITGSTTNQNLIIGNYIGLQIGGNAALPNGTASPAGNGDGIRLTSGADSNTIGGPAAGERNYIAGNTDDGIEIRGDDINNVEIAGNYIGVNVAGTAAVPNGGDGVRLDQGARSCVIGGFTLSHGNLISGNTGAGVRLRTAANNTLRNNAIGLDAPLALPIPNAIGVVVEAGSSGNAIGVVNGGNAISGNTTFGVDIVGTGNASETELNTLRANRIGTNPAGTAAIPNGSAGVRLSAGAEANTLGGSLAGEGNVLSGNGAEGVLLTGSNTKDNVIQGNTIGAALDGVTPLGNASDGIRISDANNTTIGGETAAHGNLIAHNGNEGVEISGAAAAINTMRRNRITANGAGIPNRGIQLNGGNINLAAPNVLTASPIAGITQANAALDIFADEGDQGGIYLTSLTASGDGSFTSALDVTPYQGMRITATVTDAFGNTSSFGVGPLVPDTTPPVITLLGPETLVLECGDTDPDPMAQAIDNVDGDITAQGLITVVGTTLFNALRTPGNYTLRYNVSDAAGNAAVQVSRPAQVVDTTPPDLELLGETALTLACFEEYEDAGATATDTCDDDVTITVGPLDTTTPGVKTLTITAQDNAGNTDVATRTITVLGAIAPVIYVNPFGNDAPGAGGTPNNPFATIGYAMAQAACVATNENPVTINLAAGVYDEVINFVDNVAVRGAGMDFTVVTPTPAAINGTVGPYAVAGAVGSAMSDLSITLPAGAPNGTRIVSLIDVDMDLQRVDLNGVQASSSVGVYVRSNGSSPTLVKDSRIRSVVTGLDIAFSAARFAFNDFENINGGAAIRISQATGDTPVVGDIDDLVTTGSNIFRNITNGFLVQSDSNVTTRAQVNAWEEFRELNNIIGRFGGIRPDVIDIQFPLFVLDDDKGILQSQLFASVLDDATGEPLPGATVTLNASQRSTVPESGTPGVYSATVSQGQYTLRAQKSGYAETVSFVTIGPGNNDEILRMEPSASEGEVEVPAIHTADTSSNNAFDLSELLRVVQLYNSPNGFSCGSGEDGYQLGSGSKDCQPHGADFEGNQPNWRLSLTELLRIVQLYNVGAYFACPGSASEDGYCPGNP
ncbi:MAG: hypothetical protein RLZZ303_2526 [Candidatus Hydrogenedentota bacterium]